MSTQAPVVQGTAPTARRAARDGQTAKDRHTRTPTRRTHPKRYMVIVENDEVHSFPYVIEVLRNVCGHDRHRAYRLTNQVHFQGQAVVWIGPLEHAEVKASLIRAYGPDRFARRPVEMPLGVRLERFDEE